MTFFWWIIGLHFSEHIAQIIELYGMKMPRPECLGLLGLFYPYLMHSEWLHYGHALLMLVGLYYFKAQARSFKWWKTTLLLQHYHHLEHLILLVQAIVGVNLFNFPKPISIGQLWFPRLELHFAYNLMVLIPMILAFDPWRKKVSGDSL
jgi:hypothetical protein